MSFFHELHKNVDEIVKSRFYKNSATNYSLTFLQKLIYKKLGGGETANIKEKGKNDNLKYLVP